MKIAVCVSGITSRIPEYKKVIELQRKVFGEYDFFFQQWEGYPKPDVPNCLYSPEPEWDYHCILEANKNLTVKSIEDIPDPAGR